MDIKTILNPKAWLVITGIMHAGGGVLSQLDMGNETQVIISGWFLLTTFTMLYAALMMEGEQQARLALVIAGPVWVWFIISIVMELEITMGKEPMMMNWKDNAVPLLLWGLLALSGLLGSGWI